jgi:hypothetical protein
VTENGAPNTPPGGQSVESGSQPPSGETRRSFGGGWIVGAILILIGLVFLVQNFTAGFQLQNWWALFILIPALGSLGSAWRIYRSQGRLSHAVRGPLVGGLILLLVTAIFLFNLDWGKVWPAFLIVAGAGMLFTAL